MAWCSCAGGFAESASATAAVTEPSSTSATARCYGLEEVCHNWRSGENIPFQFSLRALGHVDVLTVPDHRAGIYRLTLLTGSIAATRSALPSHMRKQREGDTGDWMVNLAAEAGVDHGTTDLLEKIVEGRFINGTTTMMINLDRCTRCDDCVRACAAAHNR